MQLSRRDMKVKIQILLPKERDNSFVNIKKRTSRYLWRVPFNQYKTCSEYKDGAVNQARSEITCFHCTKLLLHRHFSPEISISARTLVRKCSQVFLTLVHVRRIDVFSCETRQNRSCSSSKRRITRGSKSKIWI